MIDLRRAAVVLNQQGESITVAYAGIDIHKAIQLYKEATGPGTWALHVSHSGRKKRNKGITVTQVESANKESPQPNPYRKVIKAK